MAVFSKQGLIAELLDRTELLRASTQPFLRLSEPQLLFCPAPGKWSIAQIFGHLNIAHDLQLRGILQRVLLAPDVKSQPYTSGWLGDFLYEKMMPRSDGSIFRLPSPRGFHADIDGLDGPKELQLFLQQCDTMDDILRHVSTKDLQGIRIPLTFTRLVRLRLGDNLRFIVAHNERHLLQAHHVMRMVPAVAD